MGQTKNKRQNLSKQMLIKKLHDESAITICHKAQTFKCLLVLVKKPRQYQMCF